MENQKNNQLQIELKDDVAQGTYANLAIIMQYASGIAAASASVLPAGRGISISWGAATYSA